MLGCAIIMVLLLLVGAAAGRWMPFYARLMDKPPQRFLALEGLRGFLAIAVFFHHAEMTRCFVQTGEWSGDSQFFMFLGRAGVSCFFMITGLLFWDKVLAADGKLNVLSLYRSRIRRIVPMYTFSVACIMVGVAWSSGFTLRVPMRNLVDTVLAWGAFGACGFPDVNGVSRTLLIAAGVHWTLTYEWAFYLALPLAASFRKPLPFAVMLVVCWFYAIHLGGYGAVVYFLVGMVVATVLRAKSPPAALRGPACGALALLLLFAGGYTMRNGHFGLPGVLLMSCFFYLLASGNTLGGFLSSRPARVLGTASYSIYLMHGIVLFAVRSIVSIKDASPIKVLLFDAGCGLLMVIVSLLTYQWVEHPFIVTRAAAEPVAPPLPAVAIPSRV